MEQITTEHVTDREAQRPAFPGLEEAVSSVSRLPMHICGLRRQTNGQSHREAYGVFKGGNEEGGEGESMSTGPSDLPHLTWV